LILAAAEVLEEHHPGIVTSGQVQFFGIDLDPLCVLMCDINMRLYGIGQIARLADVVDTDKSDLRRVPPDLLNALVLRPATIVQGNALAPETENLLREPQPWIPLTVQRVGLSLSPHPAANADLPLVVGELPEAPTRAASPDEAVISTDLPAPAEDNHPHPLDLQPQASTPPASKPGKRRRHQSPYIQGTLF
jgi:hypothetical protein